MSNTVGPTTDPIQLLRATEQRATPQRLMILSVLQDASRHLTADEVFQQLGPTCPALNRSTVYRTLERFRDAGIVSETDLGGGVRVYEVLAGHRHHHLICHQCNDMIEMDDDAVEAMRVLIRARYGFEPRIDHLAIWGICPECGAREDEA
ncbi:MAG: transcriptional repressor [Thermomicrobiales bacterium]|nr:transcriptional repressor [Thermomicrobiales bacterium]